MRSKMSAIGTSDSAFHDGNPSTGELGTIVTADWLNAVQASTMDLQDELLNVLAAASIANDPAVKTQILAAINKLSKLNMQSGAATFATDTGAANAYVVSLTPALAAPRGEGMVIRFKVANTNTGACTVNDGVSTVPIVGLALSALQGGEMAAGGYAWVQWHSAVGTGSYVLLYCTGAPMQVANALKAQHAVAFSQLAGVIGSTRNLKCSITAASSTATFTADELVVETALGGLKYQISSLNKVINLATTGVGGMDTGAAPVSGYVAVYAILNPTTGATALLGVNTTSAVAPEVYVGSNMPAGYTASALIAVIPTTSGSLFTVGYLDGRDFYFNGVSILSTTVQQASLTSLSISGVVPKNAKAVSGYASVNGFAAASNNLWQIAGSASGVGAQAFGTNNSGNLANFSKVPLISLQTLYYSCTTTSTPMSAAFYLSMYSF